MTRVVLTRRCAWCGVPLEPGEGPELVTRDPADGTVQVVTSHGICDVCADLVDQELEDEGGS